MPTLNEKYWESRYQQGDTGWDIGQASSPLLHFFQELKPTGLKILIPGCGNAYEAEELLKLGFTDITLLDMAESPLLAFEKKNPKAIAEGKIKLLCEDFFNHADQYDLIIEQTFFCALQPELRNSYAKHMHDILKPGARLAGLLFNFPLTSEGPPFGGSKESYIPLFEPYFSILKMEPCLNSISPRLGRELFFILQKPA